jgi:hypothetical protein
MMALPSISKTIVTQNLGCYQGEEIFLLREFLKNVRIVLIQYPASLTKQPRSIKWVSMILRLTENFGHYSIRTSACRNIKPK